MKQTMMRRVGALAMASATVCSMNIYAGENAYNETGYPIVNEELTVTVAGPMPSGLEDWTQVAVVEEYAQRLGIRLDCDFYATDWDTKLTLMVAEDGLPDMLANCSINIADVNKWGAEGYFLNLKDYMDLMPNMKAYFEQYPELEAYCTAPDGAIYGLPCLYTDMTDRLTRSFVNHVWLDNLGLSVPTSIDELYDVLVAFKEQDANGNGDTSDEIPMLYGSGYEALQSTLLDAFGIHTKSIDLILQADQEGKVYLANTSDAFKEYLKFMHKLYTEGLMEQEAFTITGDEITSKQQDDVYGVFGCGSAPFVMANKDISYDANWAGLCGLTSSLNDTRTAGLGSPVGGAIRIAVNANVENPEAMARFIDYFYTEEGALASNRGYDGVTLDMVTNEKLGVDVPVMRVPDGYTSGEEYRYKGAVLNNAFTLVESNPDRGALFEVDMEVLKDEEVLNEFGWAAIVADAYRQDGVEGVNVYPAVSYTEEEIDERATLNTDIEMYLKQVKTQFITGELDIDSEWENVEKTLNQMGLERLLEIEQAAYDRYAEVIK